MNRGPEYLSPEDLAYLMGTDNLRSAMNQHRTIREALTPPELIAEKRCKQNLTIFEYCKYVGDDYEHVHFILRGVRPK